MHLTRKNPRFLLQTVLLASEEGALLVGSPGFRAAEQLRVGYDHLNEVLSFSVLDALLNELFKLVACGFQVLFIIDESRYDGLDLEYAFSLFIEGRR